MPFPFDFDVTWMNTASVQYTAQELRRSDATMYGGSGASLASPGGIVRHGDQSLAVTINGSDVVTVQPGAVVIPGNNGVGNGCYRAAVGSAQTGSLAARNATNPRIDLVVIRALDTDVVTSHANYTGRIEVIQGTAAASPVAPALPDMAVELARISVPSSSGGAATVDSSYRSYVFGVNDEVLVSTEARLPAAGPILQRARALDTNAKYLFNGTNWIKLDTLQTSATTQTFSGATPTAVPGLTVTKASGGLVTTFVTLEADVEALTNSGTFVFYLYVDGAQQATQIPFSLSAGDRRFVSRRGVITGLADGPHTFAVRAACAVGSLTARVNAPHSVLTAETRD